METGGGELERGEETVEPGEEAGDTGVDGGVAPCTVPDGDDTAPLGEGGVEEERLGLLPSPACSSA